MSKKKPTLLQKLLLFAFSGFLILGFLGLAEVYFRLFSDINFLENSKGTFAPQRFGASYGNTPNYEGVSFGEKFYIDAEGFRADPQFKPTADENSPAVLMLGDSVLFGPALTEDKTIGGILRRDLPNVKIYNTAAIGYDTFDYRNLGNSLIPQKADVKTVFVVYCLNDLIPTSSQQIKEQVTNPVENQPAEDASVMRVANDYLRSRSKFYLFLKSVLRDTQMIYFQNDLAQYQEDETLKKGLQPLVDLKKHLDENNVRLKIFISPYEAQLRAGTPEDFLIPQKKLTEFFAQNGIEFYDMMPDFKEAAGDNPKSLYLYGDPMHFNAKGNKIAAQIIESDIGK